MGKNPSSYAADAAKSTELFLRVLQPNREEKWMPAFARMTSALGKTKDSIAP